MDQKVVLITGCSSGIGKALAFEFHNKGCKVFASARDVSKLGDLKNKGIECVELDVNNQSSIERAVDEVLVKAERIDILVNNAGVSCYAPAIDCTLDEVRLVTETNYFAVVALTQAVVHKYMLNARSGTIVNISSIMAEVASPFSGVYSASKAAVSSYSDALRIEVAPFGIHVVTVLPGKVRSEIANNTATRTTAMLSRTSYSQIEDAIKTRAQYSQKNPMEAEDFAAQVVPKILLAKPPPAIRLGPLSTLFYFWNKFFPYWFSDWILSRMIGVSKLYSLLKKESPKQQPKKLK